jgi:hypothetical protein
MVHFHLESLANKKISGDRAFDSLLLAFYASLQKALGFSVPGLFCIDFCSFYFLVYLSCLKKLFYGRGMLANFKASTVIIIERAGQTLYGN